MIAKTYIIQNLKTIERLYAESNSSREALMYSKLAILELCGWIEESMDSIIRFLLLRRLQETSNRDYLLNAIIKRQRGFDYDSNFRKTLISAIGLAQVEKLERRVDQTIFTRMCSVLNTLKVFRDDEAHTYLRVTRRLDAPSVTKNRFPDVYEGLKTIEDVLRKMRL